MPYCPKCGSEINEEMGFCPKCGAALKAEQATAQTRTTTYRRNEKAEKDEKNEKNEKHEKRGYSFLGPLVGGLILMFIGLGSYLEITGVVEQRTVWAFFFLVIGALIIVGAIYGALIAGKRHPKI